MGSGAGTRESPGQENSAPLVEWGHEHSQEGSYSREQDPATSDGAGGAPALSKLGEWCEFGRERLGKGAPC